MLFQLTPSQQYLNECEAERVAQARATLERLKYSFAKFWADPIHNAELMGTFAAQAFNVHALSAAYVAAIAPELVGEIPQVDATRWQLTFGEDGSLTIEDARTAPQPEEA